MAHPGPIDVQTHYVPPAQLAAIEGRTEMPRMIDGPNGKMVEYGAGAAYPVLTEMIDLEVKIQDMDKAGLGMSVLSLNIPGLDWLDDADAAVVARDSNDELKGAVDAYPERFAALSVLPLQTPEAAVAELERTMGLGFNGTMVYSNCAGRHLDEPAFRQVFDAAGQLDAPVLIHPTYPLSAETVNVHALIPVLGFLFDTTTATMRLILDGIYDRNPEMKLILGHVGSVIPYILGRIDTESGRIPGGLGNIEGPVSEHVSKLWIDTVGAWPPAFQLAIDYLGVEKVLYATDHPFWDPDWTRDSLAEVELSDADRAAIETENAKSLLKIS